MVSKLKIIAQEKIMGLIENHDFSQVYKFFQLSQKTKMQYNKFWEIFVLVKETQI